MTAPTQTSTLGRPADQDQLDAQTMAYEQAMEDAAVAALLAALAGIAAQAALRLSLGLPFTDWLVDALVHLRVHAADEVRARVQAGLRLGAIQAIDDAGATDLPLLVLDDATTAVIDTMDARAEATIGEAVRLAGRLPMGSEQDLTSVMAQAYSAANNIRADARWVANRAANAGTAAVAAATGSMIVWVCERGACLVCLALSGQLIEPGGEFDASLTFGDKPMPLFPIRDPMPLDHPPRHPGCRCSLRLWRPGNFDLPTVLRREAQRAVARGWSEYASKPARLRAADRLLHHANLLLPRSVAQRGRRDVARGKFTTDPRIQHQPGPAGK